VLHPGTKLGTWRLAQEGPMSVAHLEGPGRLFLGEAYRLLGKAGHHHRMPFIVVQRVREKRHLVTLRDPLHPEIDHFVMKRVFAATVKGHQVQIQWEIYLQARVGPLTLGEDPIKISAGWLRDPRMYPVMDRRMDHRFRVLSQDDDSDPTVVLPTVRLCRRI